MFLVPWICTKLCFSPLTLKMKGMENILSFFERTKNIILSKVKGQKTHFSKLRDQKHTFSKIKGLKTHFSMLRDQNMTFSKVKWSKTYFSLNYKLIYLIFSFKLVYFTYKLMYNLKLYQIYHDLIAYFVTLTSPKKVN